MGRAHRRRWHGELGCHCADRDMGISQMLINRDCYVGDDSGRRESEKVRDDVQLRGWLVVCHSMETEEADAIKTNKNESKLTPGPMITTG